MSSFIFLLPRPVYVPILSSIKTSRGFLEMITRSKLVDQLRDYQIRSQHRFPALIVFSPKPYISSRGDILVAVFWALVFGVLVVSSYLTLYNKDLRLSSVVIFIGFFLLIRLRLSRQALTRKKERRLLLPLSM